MGIKTKLGLGVATAALGLSLVGGGTWAAFNDVKTLNDNHITTGVLKLGLDPATKLISLDKLVPGDKIARNFKISNVGNVDIKQVLMNIGTSGWSNVGDTNSEQEFLSQFKVYMFAADAWDFNSVGGGKDLLTGITPTGTDAQGHSYISLWDLKQQATGNYDITRGTGLPNGTIDADGKDFDKIYLGIEFVNKDLKDPATGLQLQNKYEGETDNISFTLEATQRDGVSNVVNGGSGDSGATE
jgi:spore coat-associated protein N